MTKGETVVFDELQERVEQLQRELKVTRTFRKIAEQWIVYWRQRTDDAERHIRELTA